LQRSAPTIPPPTSRTGFSPQTLGRQAPSFGAIADRDKIEFRSVVEAVSCAIEVQTSLIERNAGAPSSAHAGDAAAHDDVLPPPVGAAAKRRRGSNARREGSRLWAM
jgi:hypothetical protein